MAQRQRVGFQTRRLGVQIPLASKNILFIFKINFYLLFLKGGLGLVGYDDCLTRSRSRVRFSEAVQLLINFLKIKKLKK